MQAKKYTALIADPPWSFQDQGSRITPTYDLMSLEDICNLGSAISDITATDSLAFIWCPSALLFEGLAVMEAWQYTLKSTAVWCKVNAKGVPMLGMGKYLRNAHELVLIGARGKASRLVRDHSIPSWFTSPRTKHSAKPAKLHEMVEALVEGPYLELFAREQRPRWTCIGNELENGGGNMERDGVVRG